MDASPPPCVRRARLKALLDIADGDDDFLVTSRCRSIDPEARISTVDARLYEEVFAVLDDLPQPYEARRAVRILANAFVNEIAAALRASEEAKEQADGGTDLKGSEDDRADCEVGTMRYVILARSTYWNGFRWRDHLTAATWDDLPPSSDGARRVTRAARKIATALQGLTVAEQLAAIIQYGDDHLGGFAGIARLQCDQKRPASEPA